ncbi:MAG: NIPSNAP family protein [Actinomycetota bacterium]|nr:NIPSNAP family protein [Actinomycetota bacterium]
MLFELRQYRCHEGQRDNWVRYMEEVIIPFQVSKGMVIAGSFTGEDEDNLYIWIRRFASEEERAALYKAVYKSDTWVNDISPKIPEMLDREQIKVTRLIPTAKSIIS